MRRKIGGEKVIQFGIRIVTAVAVICSTAWPAAFTTGDVFVAVGSGQVKEFTPSGSLVQTLNDGSGSVFTTGMAFDGSGNLYVTNVSGTTISKFNADGTLASSAFFTGFNTPESILVDGAGNFLVGGPHAPIVSQYSPAGGGPTRTFTVQGGNGTGGTDWIDLAADQQTLFYDGEGTVIRRFNLATNTQSSDFGSASHAKVFAFRIIPSGPFAGDIAAADSTEAILFDSSGNIIKHYTLPGNGGGDFALNLDPNGKDFWTSDSGTGNIWEVNIATGAIDEQFASGAPGTTFGLVVKGEITASGTPEPTTLSLSVLCGIVFIASRLRKNAAMR